MKTRHITSTLSVRRTVLIFAVACTTILTLQVTAQEAGTLPFAHNSGNNAHSKAPAFDVVSIRPSKPGGQPSMRMFPDGYSASNQNLWTVIMTAYFPQGFQYWSNDRLLGAPPWVRNESFDIYAKVSPNDLVEWQKQGPQKELLRAMLQTMLAERCKLALHHTATNSRIYVLVVGKHGSKLQESRVGEKLPSGVSLPGGGLMIPGRGDLKFFNTSMTSLATFLSGSSPRPIADKTGLEGTYDFVLPRRDEGNRSATDPDPVSGYMVQDLGLALKPAKAPIDTLVIDHIDRPSAN
ncbi:MAG: TIGR03435 family protein [Acidobacteriaceae bacterium]